MNCCVNFDVGVDIKYVNETGENLLVIESIALHDIGVSHKIDGEWKGYFEGHHDLPNSVRIIDRENEKYLKVSLSLETDEDNISETKLVIQGTSEIIIKAEVRVNGGSTVVTKLWNNGELRWEAGDGGERILTIVK